MSLYTNNQSSTPYVDVGTLPAPYYWWEAGAVWGGMVDYWAYTQDDSYVPTVTQALLAQVGPDDNYMAPVSISPNRLLQEASDATLMGPFDMIAGLLLLSRQ